MRKQKIPTLPISDLEKNKIPSLNPPGSEREMKSTSVKSDIDELAKLLKDKTKDGIAIFNSALKVCIENNPNALLHEAAEHGKKIGSRDLKSKSGFYKFYNSSGFISLTFGSCRG